MGSQQLLLILMSVIIVGIAIATGISVMNYQAKSQNRQAIISDMHYVASQAVMYYKIPESFGGGNGQWNETDLETWIILPRNAEDTRFVTKNGEIGMKTADNV